MNTFFACLAALLTASAAAGCTWTSTCEGQEKCEDAVYLDDHATGEGSASLTCKDEYTSQISVSREFRGIAVCKYTPEDGLLVRVGSNTCDDIGVLIRDFTGPGVYETSDALGAAAMISLYVVKPGTGCQEQVSGIQSYPIDGCTTPSDPCTIQVEGDVTPTRGGDLSLTIECGRLAYNHAGTCGECTPDAPFQVHIDDCELTE
jgi:hypothetical protein